jgi:acyl carrier protein
MTKPEITHRAKELLISGLRLDIAPEDIVDGDAIFGSGLGLDSIDALEFVVLLEEAFGVSIPDETVAKEALASIDALVAFVARERERQGLS